MSEKKVSKNEPKIIKKLEIRLRKFERYKKIFQESWRKVGEADKEKVQNVIKKLETLIRDIRKGKSVGPLELELALIKQIETSIDLDLQVQKMQKYKGMELTPFGEYDLSKVFDEFLNRSKDS